MVDSDLQSSVENRGCAKEQAESQFVRRAVRESVGTTEGLVCSASQEKCLQRY